MLILIKLVLLSIISFQLTQIITESTLFQPIRSYFYLPDGNNTFISNLYNFIYKLLDCFLCSSVWISLILLLVVMPNFNIMWDLFEIKNIFISVFLDTMLVSGVAWFLHCLEHNWSK